MTPLRSALNPRVFGNGHLEVGIQGTADGSKIRLVGWGLAEKREIFEGLFEALLVLDSAPQNPYGPSARIVDARPCKNPATS